MTAQTNMNERIAAWNAEAEACPCGSNHHHVDMYTVISDHALEDIASYLQDKGYQHVTVIDDPHTASAAGYRVLKLLQQAGIQAEEVCLPFNNAGDVVADERYMVKVLLGISSTTEAVLAVGSGTIHDLTRFACSMRKLPFISVPTAASVDGFTSAGAPLLLDGVKRTIQTVAPEAIFADVSLLASAPQTMTAAGFGDMLGKYTSLADWKVSRDLAQEPYCPLGARMTEEALLACIEHVDEIAAGSPCGMDVLIRALIASGISMLIIDHSRPASGGEHHISHRIEMELLAQDRPQVLHGAKVGVAAALLTDLYKGLAVQEPESAFQVYRALPDSQQMRDWLQQVGGPGRFDELGVTEDMLERAVHTAHTLRDRYTGLKYLNDHNLIDSNTLQALSRS